MNYNITHEGKDTAKPDHILEVDAISVKYGIRRSNEAVKSISFTISRQGTCVALVGPNGAGKTTTIKAVLGLLKTTSGSIKKQGRFAYLPENASIYQYLTCSENVSFYLKFSGGSGNPLEFLDLVGMTQMKDTSGYKLSKGQKRRLNLAMILSSGANVICLDEPFEGLDPLSSFELAQLINNLKKTGKSFLVSSHALDLVDNIADEIIFMSAGKASSDIRKQIQGALIIEITSPMELAVDVCKANNFDCIVRSTSELLVKTERTPEEVLRKLIEAGVDVKYSRRQNLQEAFRDEFGS
ncbi:MAG: ABC transporter ATP-binding protein [Thermoplasmata archaeon]